VGLNSVRVEGKHQKFNLFEVLKVSPLSQDVDNSLRQKPLDIYRADKRIREREGIEPDRRQSKSCRVMPPTKNLPSLNFVQQIVNISSMSISHTESRHPDHIFLLKRYTPFAAPICSNDEKAHKISEGSAILR
jgi:hypothetical protein